MRKLISVLAGLGLAAFLPVSAFAASISGAGTAIFTGQTNLYGNAGNTVNVSTNFDVAAGEVLHAIQTDQIGDMIGPVCHVVGVVEGQQANIPVSFTETLSPNAGNYGYTMTAFTAATVPQANALNAIQGTACTGSSVSVYNQSNVVHVLPGGGVLNNGGAPVQVDQWAQLQITLSGILDLLKHMQAPPEPSKPACPPAYTGGNAVAVQTWLLSNGFAAPFNQIGVYAATGFWGNASQTAYGLALNACK